ncbi:hypothetical protein FB451DRAFT_1472498 [Mycena latifolia]|nr:hypothetical protein FB451DRAFT_1472498 [Mycena latifolia]
MSPNPNTPLLACQLALAKYLAANPPPPFPSYENNANREATVCLSHAVRSGLEHLADRHIYDILDWTLQATCPDRSEHFGIIVQAISCNSTLGKIMAALGMHSLTDKKEGGDTYETVFGSLLKDRSYPEMVEHGIRTFQPLVTDPQPKRLRGSQSSSPTLLSQSPSDATPALPTSIVDFTTGEATLYLEDVLSYIRSRRPPSTPTPTSPSALATRQTSSKSLPAHTPRAPLLEVSLNTAIARPPKKEAGSHFYQYRY